MFLYKGICRKSFGLEIVDRLSGKLYLLVILLNSLGIAFFYFNIKGGFLMNKRFFYIANTIFLLLPVISFAGIKIGIVGDQTGSADLNKSYTILQEGCQTLSANGPDIVLHVGDIIESSQSNDEIKTNFRQAVSYLNCIQKDSHIVPWYITAGDHDVNPPNDYTPGTKNKEKADLFLELVRNEYSKRAPCVLPDNLYYSFDHDGYHFICLYSEDILRTDPRWGNIFMNKISDKQFKWLENNLSMASSAKGIIVFVHQPMWYNLTGWKKVHNLLRKYHVIAVIAGHFHYNQDEGNTDGIRYIVVGSAGGNIKNASENAGGIYHVTLMMINDSNEISLQLIPLHNYSNSKFTKRENMDRIQVIDTMLDIIAWNPKVTAKGNPIDIPVDIYSMQGSNNYQPLYENVDPGEGVTISNLSTVELNDDSGERLSGLQGMKVQFKDEEGQIFWDSMRFNSGLTSEIGIRRNKRIGY